MHAIRLRRPWLRSHGGQAPPDKVDVPDGESVKRAAGEVVAYRRAFQRPTGLVAENQVWLAIEKFDAASIRVFLNESPVGEPDVRGFPLRIDISGQMETSNRLTIELVADEAGIAQLDGAVSLQIS